MISLWRYVGTAEEAISPHVLDLWHEAEARGRAVLDWGSCGICFAVHPSGWVYQLIEGSPHYEDVLGDER